MNNQELITTLGWTLSTYLGYLSLRMLFPSRLQPGLAWMIAALVCGTPVWLLTTDIGVAPAAIASVTLAAVTLVSLHFWHRFWLPRRVPRSDAPQTNPRLKTALIVYLWLMLAVFAVTMTWYVREFM